ncbi:hypothetical protein ACFE04_006181 [Oxalis oulophora]
MTLLEAITKAVAANHTPVRSLSEYPITLNPDDSFPDLKPEVENPSFTSLAIPLSKFVISQNDVQVIESSKKFEAKLRRKLKDTNNFGKDEFVSMLNLFLGKYRDKVSVSVGMEPSENGYTRVLMKKVGFLMGREISCLILEACVSLEIWELVETMIVNKLFDQSFLATLIPSLVVKNKADIICLCIKQSSDIGSTELLIILKYFLCPPKSASAAMENVRKEWESQALLAIEKATDDNLSRKKPFLAKAASILLMVAYDGFSTSELCLHYLLSSPNLDEVIFSSIIGELNGNEIMNLIKYLHKWLKKYQRFPQAGPCPKASSAIGLKACDWVPKLEDVVKCMGFVVDENYSSLMMNSEFHDTLRSLQGLISLLAGEARLCSSVANLIENLRVEV